MPILGRFRRALRRYGVRGTLARLATLLSELVRLDQTHVWYELPLTDSPPRLRLEPPLRLVRADTTRLGLLDDLWAIDPGEAARRLADEGTLWFVLDGERPVFSCWTFRRRTPIRAAPGGWLALPDDTACLEESLTVAGYRGRGVAPAAWSEVVERLRGEPLRRLVATIEQDNTASRRVVEKIGFHEIGTVHTRRRAGRLSVSAEPLDGDAAFLRGLLR